MGARTPTGVVVGAVSSGRVCVAPARPRLWRYVSSSRAGVGASVSTSGAGTGCSPRSGPRPGAVHSRRGAVARSPAMPRVHVRRRGLSPTAAPRRAHGAISAPPRRAVPLRAGIRRKGSRIALKRRRRALPARLPPRPLRLRGVVWRRAARASAATTTAGRGLLEFVGVGRSIAATAPRRAKGVVGPKVGDGAAAALRLVAAGRRAVGVAAVDTVAASG